MSKLIIRLFWEEQGQGLVEYAILIGLIVVAVVGLASVISTWVLDRFTAFNSDLQDT